MTTCLATGGGGGGSATLDTDAANNKSAEGTGISSIGGGLVGFGGNAEAQSQMHFGGDLTRSGRTGGALTASGGAATSPTQQPLAGNAELLELQSVVCQSAAYGLGGPSGNPGGPGMAKRRSKRQHLKVQRFRACCWLPKAATR